MRFRSALVLLAGALAISVQALPAKPRLVVVISIDQYRADYLNRFADFYLPAKTGTALGGFNYLSEMGANYLDAHHRHVPTATGPGHAAILTGSVPALNGIVGNSWIDRVTNKPVYCVDDPSVETVGGPSKPMSPSTLQVTTVGDELKLATNGKAKVVGVSFKDRAAILMAGHAADTVIWFDGGNAAWVTSTFYAPNKQLPKWVADLNSKKIPDSEINKTWTPLLPDSAYSNTRLAPFAKRSDPKPIFSHPMKGDNPKGSYRNWTTSSFGQEYVFRTANAAIQGESLGQDSTPDILAINLATNDYIGHMYGPNSPEVMDISVRTDRLLSDFFNTLEKTIPGGMKNVVIAVTADHGVMPIAEELSSPYRIPTLRITEKSVSNAVNQGLSAEFGEGEWFTRWDEINLYLNRELIASKKLDLQKVQQAAARILNTVPGIQSAWSVEDVLRGDTPDWPWIRLAANNYFATRSGDVFVFTKPGAIPDEGTGTGHGSAWTYDSHVPLVLAGGGIPAGTYSRNVGVTDLAPTLSALLRIEQPSGCFGAILKEVTDSP